MTNDDGKDGFWCSRLFRSGRNDPHVVNGAGVLSVQVANPYDVRSI